MPLLPTLLSRGKLPYCLKERTRFVRPKVEQWRCSFPLLKRAFWELAMRYELMKLKERRRLLLPGAAWFLFQ